MSFGTFITTIETELEQDASAALAAAKTSVAYVEGVVVNEILPDLAKAIMTALSSLGSELLTQVLGQLAPGATVTVPAVPETPPPV